VWFQMSCCCRRRRRRNNPSTCHSQGNKQTHIQALNKHTIKHSQPSPTHTSPSLLPSPLFEWTTTTCSSRSARAPSARCRTKTQNPKPQTPNPKAQIQNPKPQTPNPLGQVFKGRRKCSPDTVAMKFIPKVSDQTSNPKPQTLNPKPQTPTSNLKHAQHGKTEKDLKSLRQEIGDACARAHARTHTHARVVFGHY